MFRGKLALVVNLNVEEGIVVFFKNQRQTRKLSKVWIVQTQPWITIGYVTAVLLSWLILFLLTGHTSGYRSSAVFQLCTKIPLIGSLLFPLGQSVYNVFWYLLTVTLIGVYGEYFLGHRYFAAITGSMFVVLQYIALANHFTNIMLLWMVLTLIGIAAVGAWYHVPCPGWLQAFDAVGGLIWLEYFLPITIDASIEYYFWFGVISLLGSGTLAFMVSFKKQGSLKRAPLAQLPWVTIGCCCLLVILFLGEVVINHGVNEYGAIDSTAVVKMGLPQEIDSVGSVFRQLLLAPPMQRSIGHLTGNVVVIFICGLLTERVFGHLKTFLILILGGWGSALIRSLVTLWAPAGIFISFDGGFGASGMAFALMGATLFFAFAAKNVSIGTKSVFYALTVVNIYQALSNLMKSGFADPTVEVADDVHFYGLMIGLTLSISFFLWSRLKHHQSLPGLDNQ